MKTSLGKDWPKSMNKGPAIDVFVDKYINYLVGSHSNPTYLALLTSKGKNEVTVLNFTTLTNTER